MICFLLKQSSISFIHNICLFLQSDKCAAQRTPAVPVVWLFSTPLIWLGFNEADTFTLHIMNPPVTSLTHAVSILTCQWEIRATALHHGHWSHRALARHLSLGLQLCQRKVGSVRGFPSVFLSTYLVSLDEIRWKNPLVEWIGPESAHDKIVLKKCYKQDCEVSPCSYIFSWALYLHQCNHFWHLYMSFFECLLCILPIAD